ncbi:hypothetical protein Nepgr_027123 [Nepenthes gracilis]|uniref:Uncharacterized protein n=1 Tax=Nepenthes gracilis TaxID=150966 RepID=A0AAD3T834_NEPGR|nr:hypothetical protein Nepgr_027123 [Nepenthes gracilis]
MVVGEHFAVKIPDDIPLDTAAPMLCAGISAYSSLRYYALDKSGMHVGVVGLGGLGHFSVKFAKAFGAKQPDGWLMEASGGAGTQKLLGQEPRKQGGKGTEAFDKVAKRKAHGWAMARGRVMLREWPRSHGCADSPRRKQAAEGVCRAKGPRTAGGKWHSGLRTSCSEGPKTGCRRTASRSMRC